MFDHPEQPASLSPDAPAPLTGVLADLAALGTDVSGLVRRPATAPDAHRPMSLGALANEVESRLGRFDADRYTGAQAAEVVALTERMIRICHAAQLAAIGRADEAGAWRDAGVRGCTEWVRRTLDRTWGEANRLVETAARLREQPHVARLAASGEITLDRVVTAAETVAERPDAAVAVCTAATRGERAEYRAICRRLRQAGETDEERAARHRRNRRASTTIDDEGMFEFRALGPADEGAELQSLYQPWVDQALRDAWALGVPVTTAQARWDGLLAMARAAAEPAAPASEGAAPSLPIGPESGPSAARTAKRPAGLARGRGSRVKVIIRVDLPALARGAVAAGELCDLSGTGEIDVATVRRLIAEGAFVTAVLTGAPQHDGPEAAGTTHDHAKRDTGGPSTQLIARDATDVAHLGRVGPDDPLVPPPITSGLDPDEVTRRWRRFMDAFLDALPGRLLPVEQAVHGGRHPDAAQRTVLELCHPVCSVDGCTSAWGLEVDHVHPFTDTHETRLTDLDRKCGPHHREKSERENRERRQQQERRERPTPTGDRSAVEACA